MAILSPIKCLNCGKIFKGFLNRKYCSNKCANKYWKLKPEGYIDKSEFPEEYGEYSFIEEENDHYHHSNKGCDIEFRPKINKGGYYLYNSLCKTHNVEISRTGWEWGWHGGTDNRKLLNLHQMNRGES